jgi:hypothetical protein
MHEQRWRDLTEALPQLVWSAMPDGSCDYFSAQWTEHTGVPTHELGPVPPHECAEAISQRLQRSSS